MAAGVGDNAMHTTSWTLIARTREPGEAALQATGVLCRLYWRPLYVHARRAGQTAHQAEDTVQEFLAHVCTHEVFARADAARGRFRTFLLSSLQQFMAHLHRDSTRQKRTPDRPLLHLDVDSGEQLLEQAPTDLSADRAFDKAWALAQVDLTWQRLQAEFADAGKGEFCALLRPIISGQAATPMREVAVALGMSEGAVNVAAHRLRKQFGEYLREQVAGTLASPEEVDDEISYLRAALKGKG